VGAAVAGFDDAADDGGFSVIELAAGPATASWGVMKAALST
jgi:hypothetical protein